MAEKMYGVLASVPMPRAGGDDAALDEAAQVPVAVAHEHAELVLAAAYLQHVAVFEGQVVVAVHREQDLVVRAARLDADARILLADRSQSAVSVHGLLSDFPEHGFCTDDGVSL